MGKWYSIYGPNAIYLVDIRYICASVYCILWLVPLLVWPKTKEKQVFRSETQSLLQNINIRCDFTAIFIHIDICINIRTCLSRYSLRLGTSAFVCCWSTSSVQWSYFYFVPFWRMGDLLTRIQETNRISKLWKVIKKIFQNKYF